LQTICSYLQNVDVGYDRSSICTVSLTSSPLANIYPQKASCSGPNIDNPKELGPDYMGMWEKSIFQLPDCFIGSCRRMQMHIMIEQKNSLGQQTSGLIANCQLQL